VFVKEWIAFFDPFGFVGRDVELAALLALYLLGLDKAEGHALLRIWILIQSDPDLFGRIRTSGTGSGSWP
jgi:hypothetical protein